MQIPAKSSAKLLAQQRGAAQPVHARLVDQPHDKSAKRRLKDTPRSANISPF
jgi:hypothetical protein